MERQESLERWVAARSASKGPALALPDGTLIRWDELAELVGRAAGALRRHGVGPGSKVGLWAAPTLETVVALYALPWVGAVAIPLDPNTPDEDVVERMHEAGARRFLATLRWPDGTRPIEPDHLLASDARPPDLPEPDAEREVAIVFTSGSGGRPRGVRITAGNLEASVRASQLRIGNAASDRWLLTIPLWHVGGMSILWRTAAVGGSIALLPRFDAKDVAEAFHGGEVTIASLVPTMLMRLLEADAGPYRGLRAVLLGGASAPEQLVARALDAGLPVLTTYGMTEACSQIATVVPGEERASLGTVGRPLDGISVDVDATGEIVVEGPMVSPGYIGERRRSGPLRTGDTGKWDEHHRLVVTGRIRDLIISGGENVSPVRVEEVLGRHPAVAEIAVVGIPDDRWGEAVVAAVVPATEEFDPQLLARFARNHLAPHEVPKRWIDVDELPLLSNGKVDRPAVSRILDEMGP